MSKNRNPTKAQIKRATPSITNIVKIFKSRPKARLRMADIWKLNVKKNPNDPIHLKWVARGKTKYGFPVDVATVMTADRRFLRISRGLNEVYFELAE